MTTTAHDYIVAYYASKEDGYLDIDDPVVSNKLFDYSTPLDDVLKIEKDQLTKEKYSSLSGEAQEIIDIILNSPADFLVALGFKTFRSVNPKSVETALRKRWKDWKYAKKVVREVQEYVQEAYC